MILRPPRRMNPLFPRYFCRVEARRFTIEGVIIDFVRLALNSPKYRAMNALTEIKQYADNMTISALTHSEWKVLSTVMEQLQLIFTESFKHANPDMTSNNSRH